MTYWGAGYEGYQRCPTCGYGMLNGVCYNTEAHGRTNGVSTYASSGAPVVDLGIEIGKLFMKWWGNRQANKKKSEKISLRYPEYQNLYSIALQALTSEVGTKFMLGEWVFEKGSQIFFIKNPNGVTDKFQIPKTLKEFIERLDDTFSDYFESDGGYTDTGYDSENIKYYTSEGKPVYED